MNPAELLKLWDIVDGTIITTHGSLYRGAELVGLLPERTTEDAWRAAATQLYDGMRRLDEGTLLQVVVERGTLDDDDIRAAGDWELDADDDSELGAVFRYQRKQRFEYLRARGLRRCRMYVFFGSRTRASGAEFRQPSKRAQEAHQKRLNAAERQVRGIFSGSEMHLVPLDGPALQALFQRWMAPGYPRYPIERDKTLSLREQLFVDNLVATKTHARIGRNCFRVLSLTQLPSSTTHQLWDKLDTLDVPFDFRLSINIAVPLKSAATRALDRISNFRTSFLGDDDNKKKSAKDRGKDKAAKKAMEDVGASLDTESDETLCHVGLYAVVWGASKSEAIERGDHLRDALKQLNIAVVAEELAHDFEFFKTLPAMATSSDRWRMVSASVAADLIPKRSYSRGEPQAPMLLETATSREPFGVTLRSRKRPNDNFFISGGTGVGKSVLVNKFLSYSMLAGPHKGRVIAVDYAGPTKSTFRVSTQIFGGRYISIHGEGAKINPWPRPHVACSRPGEVSTSTLSYLTKLTNLLLHNTDDDKESALCEGVIQRGIRRVYARWDKPESPLFNDLYHAMAALDMADPDEEARRRQLLQLLEKMITGPEGALLNEPTSGDSDEDFVCYDLYGLRNASDRLKTAVAMVVTNHVRSVAFDERPDRKKYVLFDEAANLMNIGMRETLEELFTTARAHSCSVGMLTQNYMEFRPTGLASTVNMCTSSKYLLSQGRAAEVVGAIAEDMGLNAKEHKTLLDVDYEKGVYADMLVLSKVEQAHGGARDIAAKVRIMLSPFDYEVLTSDANDRTGQLRLRRSRPDVPLVNILDFRARKRAAALAKSVG